MQAIRKRWNNLRIIAEYIVADNKRNQRSFLIGTSTVLVIVMFLTLLQNALVRSGVIFVRLAEDQVGAFDFLVTADASATTNQLPFINYTQVKQPLSELDLLAGTCPRWLIRANVSAAVLVSNGSVVGNLPQQPQLGSKYASAIVLVANSTREREIGLARLWPLRPLGQAECHVSSSLLRALGVRPAHGEQVTLSVDVLSLSSAIGQPIGTGSTSGGGGSTLQPSIGGGGSSQNQSTPTTGQPASFNQTGQPAAIAVPYAALGGIPEPQRTALLTGLKANVTNGTVYVSRSNIQSYVIQNQALNTAVSCSVISAIDATYGVYPSSLGDVVYIDQVYAQQVVRQQLQLLQTIVPPALLQQIGIAVPQGSVGSFNLEDYVMLSIFVLRDRFDIYSQSSAERKTAITLAANKIMQQVGIQYPIKMQDILNQTLALSLFIQIFLNEIFFTVMVVLLVLAVILIASLLTSDAEEKTFEYGMLRMLGFHSYSLVTLLVIQSFVFSLPGVLVGLLLCYILYLPIGYYLSDVVGSVVDVSFTPTSLTLGILAGVILPIFGTVFPIRNALSSTIRDALNMYHNSVFDSTLSIKRLENIGLSLTATAIAITLVVVGFLVYYLIPLSFIFGRLDLFFRILTVILLGLVFGLVLLSQVFEPYLSRLGVWALTWLGFDSQITAVVQKNLNAHASRNRKTSVMFTLCIGYIVFVSAMFTLQIRGLSQSVEWYLGADVVITGPAYATPLPVDKLRPYLDNLMLTVDTTDFANAYVESYTFITYALNDLPNAVNSINIGRIATIVRSNVKLYGLQSNFLQVTLDEYAVPTEINRGDYSFNQTSGGRVDFVQALNLDTSSTDVAPNNTVTNAVRNNQTTFGNNRTRAYDNFVPILLSEAIRDKAAISARSRLLINIGVSGGNPSQLSYLSVPVAMLKKLPAFPTITRLVTGNTPLLMSMSNYFKLLNDTTFAFQPKMPVTVSYGRCLIRLRSDTSDLQIQAFMNQLNSLLQNSDIVVSDLRTQVKNTQAAASLINIVFNIVAMVGVLLSFFVLLLSFTANVRENSWQLGVMRAVGLTKFSVAKIFIYEALSIVISCAVLGVILGVVTAVTLTLQSNLFSEMQFMLEFPTTLFSVTVVLSLVLATLGSYFPITEFNRASISTALKG